LLDGFPRTDAQASAIKEAGASPTVVLLVNVSDDVLVVRAAKH
jgi:adenylate kinase family enzyme